MSFAVDLPIRYFEANTMMAAFSASSRRLALLTPEPLQVVEILPGRAPLAIACFDYRRTSVGPYGEVGIIWPVVSKAAPGPRRAPPLLPLMLERHWPGFGWWIHRLPVTTDIALHAGKSIWGYPKYLASIDYEWEDSVRSCTLSEGGSEILRLSVDTRMPALPRRFPLHTYSVRDDELLRTRVDVDAVGMRRLIGGRARLRLGPHPHGRELAELELSLSRPLEMRWYPVWRSLLPEAEQRTPVTGSGSGATRGAAA